MNEKDVSIWTVTSVPFFGGLLALVMVVYLNFRCGNEMYLYCLERSE